VYALGCLAFQLLTGRHPFIATSFPALLHQKLTLQLPPADRIGEGISAELYDFLRSALQPNPADRPRSLEPLVAWAAPCDGPAHDASCDLGAPSETTLVEPTDDRTTTR
jgi:serine/threonine protein kinase